MRFMTETMVPDMLTGFELAADSNVMKKTGELLPLLKLQHILLTACQKILTACTNI